MNTILVWVLMSVTASNSTISYSPIMSDLESCQRMQKIVIDNEHTRSYRIITKCIEIRVPTK
jgi:hypothetical protein